MSRMVKLVMAAVLLAAIAVSAVPGAPAIFGHGGQAARAESAAAHNRVAAGYAHSLLIDSDGVLWAWGRNTSGELGVAAYDTTDRLIPTRVGSATDWTSVAAGWYHSFGIRSDGTLWAWGENEYGQLGLGHQYQRTTPARVGTASNWVAVSAGHFHTLGLQSDGTLWVWGNNGFGRLGLAGVAQTDNITVPTQVGAGTGWVAIAAGDGHSLAVQADGSLWAWGLNSSGQLGLGHTTSKLTPTQVTGSLQMAQVEAEYDCSMGIDRDGNLYSWGNNYRGLLGQGDSVNRTSPDLVSSGWAGVYPGRVHCLGVRLDGSLYAWGSGYDGAIGLGEDVTLKESPTLVAGSSPGWTGGAAGDRFSVTLRSDGAAWGFGWNGNGQLGLNHHNKKFVPTLITLGWPLSVATSAASGILEQGAILNGSLISLGGAASAQVCFEWGVTASFGSATPAQARTSAGAFSAALPGLTAGTTYYYRARADAGGMSAYGLGSTFTTAALAATPVAPTVSTESMPGQSPEVETADADSITAGSARLNGYLASMGAAASVDVFFQWGTVSGSYPFESAALPRSAAGAFCLDVAGLAPGATYYYRTRAAGEGSCHGEEKSFTTATVAGDAETGSSGVSVTTGEGSGALEDGFSVSAGEGGSRSRGTASAAVAAAVSVTALGLVLGTAYWITRKRAK